MRRILRFLLVGSALLTGACANAFTCNSITSAGATMNYFSNKAATIQATFSVTCSRASGDANSLTYDVTTNDGSNPTGGKNRATLGISTVTYDMFTDSACSNSKNWSGNTKITNTMTWSGTTTGPQTQQTSIWVCAPAQAVTGVSGTYSDSVTATVAYPGGTSITGTIPVKIYAPATCQFNTQPGTISLNYAALGPAVSNSTTFSVTCTSGMPYTVAPNVGEGVLLNLRYTIGVNKSASNGSGVPELFTVVAAIPAGQAGTCSTATCTGTQTHTIVISY